MLTFYWWKLYVNTNKGSQCANVITDVLAGLTHEYDNFMSSTYAHIDQVTLNEVYSLLIVTESRLSHRHLFIYAPLVEAIIV
jgi:hypothetical protein